MTEPRAKKDRELSVMKQKAVTKTQVQRFETCEYCHDGFRAFILILIGY